MVKNANTQGADAPKKKKYDPRASLPVERQFGKPNGNPRGHGFWKKENTARYKLEKMMLLTETELRNVAEDVNAPYFERKLAVCIAKGQWDTIRDMINQVYGAPKQPVENIDKTPQKIKIEVLQPKKAKSKDDD